MNTLRLTRWRWLASATLVALGYAAQARAVEVVRVCTNQETIGAPTGELASQLMAHVARQLPELRFEYTPLPWSRCLKMAERGDFDAVLAGSYSSDRAKSLAYPQKADGSVDASKRMFNLGFAVIRRVGSKVTWTGNQFSHLDAPVGAQLGYSIVEYLRSQQVEVDVGSSTVISGLRKLNAGRISAMVVNPFNFDALLHEPEFAGKLEMVVDPLIQNKPYYLILGNAFVAAHPEQPPKIWKAVEGARQTAEVGNLYAKYLGQTQSGLRLKP
jgi:polar amino acid transport system substrate-binding protein